MAPTAKANYKTYDAQARLIRAIVAAHPDVKWNYKEIVACFGSDMTQDALNHRFRRYKAEAAIIAAGRKQGFDMKGLGVGDDLPKAQKDVDTKNIAKYFGQSTGDGMQFQFRSIKKDAKTLIDAANEGKRVSNDQLSGMNGSTGGGGGSAYSTPTIQRTKTPRTGSTKRKATFIKTETDFDDEEEEDDEPLGGDEDEGDSASQDWSEQDLLADTPSKKRRTTASTNRTPGQKNGVPARHAAAKRADATIADATAHMSESMSERETDMPPLPSMSNLPLSNGNGNGSGNGHGYGGGMGSGLGATTSVNPQSIFGNPSPSPAPGARGMTPLAFNRHGFDGLIGGAEFDDEITNYYGGDYGGDEI